MRPRIGIVFHNWWGWSNPNYVEWQGRVDDVAYIYFHRDEVWSEAASGRGVEEEGWRHGRPLPRASVGVRLGRVEGRGDIWIDEQPGPHNDFTTIVGIHDPHPGAGRYRFVLEW